MGTPWRLAFILIFLVNPHAWYLTHLFLVLTHQTYHACTFIHNLSSSSCFRRHWWIETNQDNIHDSFSHTHTPVSICIQTLGVHACDSSVSMSLLQQFSLSSWTWSNSPLLFSIKIKMLVSISIKLLVVSPAATAPCFLSFAANLFNRRFVFSLIYVIFWTHSNQSFVHMDPLKLQ